MKSCVFLSQSHNSKPLVKLLFYMNYLITGVSNSDYDIVFFRYTIQLIHCSHFKCGNMHGATLKIMTLCVRMLSE